MIKRTIWWCIANGSVPSSLVWPDVAVFPPTCDVFLIRPTYTGYNIKKNICPSLGSISPSSLHLEIPLVRQQPHIHKHGETYIQR